MKVKILWVLLSVLVVTTFALEFDVDYAVFKSNEDIDVVEVYLMVPRVLLKFVPTTDQYQSNALIRVALAQNDTIRDMQEWQINDRVADTLQLRGTQKIPEIATLQAKPGKYTLIVLIADLNTKQQFRYDKQLTLSQFPTEKLTLSDIQVTSQISKTGKENKFSKYFGYDIIPNASTIFGDGQTMIYSFAEIYNLKVDPANPSTYKVQYSIINLNGKVMSSSGWLAKKKPGNSAVEISNLNIASLPGGLYDYKVEVSDEISQQTTSGTKRFYIVRSGAQANMAAMSGDDLKLEGLSEKELDEYFGPLKYIATDTEIKQYKKSDLTGKKQIILHFWDRRDKNPQTPINEDRIDFEQRLQIVNEQYSTQRSNGWKTDFGRVYLLYGQPSEIERFPSALENKPYQVWHYHQIEGGVVFYFVDKNGFGSYELVHSTARNELQDIDWERWISPTSSSPSNNY